MKAALLAGTPEAKEYLKWALPRLANHAEQCAHLVNQLSMLQTPAFVFSLTTTLTSNKATIGMVGRGGKLSRPIEVLADGQSKQAAAQIAYVAFVEELCNRAIRGPSVSERVLAALKSFRKFRSQA
ncbi:hypothetical protein H8F21_15965 [Pseudomonas sp. P66]|uniref:Uncharacterized protein n=1 Tax=Pseudomonas arcuscaelestis TaxID=2710591 RepID=A0ABS2C058_9PSED|nr:hypothetical protein [Pseudomonas arcuscaelestis]MBM5459065.1 hypothetical protein [Pseudomonas arcuscaelestis]